MKQIAGWKLIRYSRQLDDLVRRFQMTFGFAAGIFSSLGESRR